MARGVGVYAKETGSNVERLVMVANAVGEPTVVLDSSAPFTRFHIAITFAFAVPNGALTVKADYAGLVSSEAFNALADRVVTTHGTDSPTQGEAQDIYGVKTFMSDVHIKNPENPKHYINISTRDDATMSISNLTSATSFQMIDANPSYGFKFSGNVIPYYNNRYSLGFTDQRWKTVYATNVPTGIGMLIQKRNQNATVLDQKTEVYGDLKSLGLYILTARWATTAPNDSTRPSQRACVYIELPDEYYRQRDTDGDLKCAVQLSIDRMDKWQPIAMSGQSTITHIPTDTITKTVILKDSMMITSPTLLEDMFNGNYTSTKNAKVFVLHSLEDFGPNALNNDTRTVRISAVVYRL